MQMDRNSLEHLLHHFCEVTANKECVISFYLLNASSLQVPCHGKLGTVKHDIHFPADTKLLIGD